MRECLDRAENAQRHKVKIVAQHDVYLSRGGETRPVPTPGVVNIILLPTSRHPFVPSSI